MVIGGRFFVALVGLLAAERLFELLLSRRHARAAFQAGAIEAGRGHYPVIVLFHTAFLASCVLELALFHPAAPAVVEDCALAVAVLAQALRYWAILTLGDRWNTRIIVWPAGPDAAPVQRGPYRFMRHPNYLAVIVELAAFPMVHGCFRTAIAFTLGNAMLLAIRIPAEERALGEAYRTAFATTRRFVPGRLDG
jgi:methyltransferase